MTRALRVARGPASVLVALALTLWTAVGVALADPGEMRIALAAGQGPDYTAGAARFRPVSLDLLRAVLGEDDVSRFLRERDLGTGTGGNGGGGIGGTGGDGGHTLPPPPDRAVLESSMTADRTEVEQGERIVFTVTVINVGTADANEVVLKAHVPAGTTLAAGDACQGDTVGVDTSGDRPFVCVDHSPELVRPPSDQHVYHTLLSTLEPGDHHRWSFTVQVSRGAEDGTVLLNHAHAAARNVMEVTSNQVAVTVV